MIKWRNGCLAGAWAQNSTLTHQNPANMKITTLLRWLIALACLISVIGYSQSVDTVYHIETTDGNEYIGTVVEQNQIELKLQTVKLGVITIKKIDIASMEIVSALKTKGGEYWLDNPQSTRYFWQPNGYGLKKGEGYYHNAWIFFNQASYGVTDNFSIGAGIMPLFLFGGAPTPIWITPKVSLPIQRDRFNLGAGILAGTIVASSEYGGGTSFGIAYGVATFGSRDRNLTAGLGYGYADGSWASNPVVTLGFMNRLGKKGYILSENYIFPGGVSLISIGGRRLVKKVSLDFGLFAPVGADLDVFLAYPWLGVGIPFRKPATTK